MSSSHKMKTLTINGVQFTIVDETVGSLSDLNTTDKSSVVAAVNEVASNAGSGSGGGSVTIDATLTQEGQAADAKAVGDKLNKLKDEISELNDVYVGADEPTDPNVQIWVNPDEDIPDVNYVKSVNGKTPDENGNVEIPVPDDSVDLTGYATEQFVQDGFQPKGDYLPSEELPNAVNSALADAKESGAFDGEKGEPGNSGVYIGSTKPVDPDINVWINPDEDLDDDTYVKSVNGITPDENGNVEIKIPESSGSSVTIDTTLTQSGQAADAKAVGDALAELEKKIPKQPADAELFDKADLPLDNQSFVTLDGVEYYRYHAGATNFEWVNPKPEKGAVTITARGVSQYGGTGSSYLNTYYDDGTSGPRFLIIKGGESQTVTVTTDENKTLARITGNYDLENWVLLDMSVMSVKADYLVTEKYTLPVATADKLGGIKADPAEEIDTQPVRIGTDGKLWTAPGGSSGGDWELIASFETTEETALIEIDADANGNSFLLKDIGIMLNMRYKPIGGGATGLRIESFNEGGSQQVRLAYIGSFSNQTQYFRKFYSDSFVVSMFGSAADNSSEVQWQGYMNASTHKVSKIILEPNVAGALFPIGIKVEVWGVRA